MPDARPNSAYTILSAHATEVRVLVDRADATFIDSSALRALLEVHATLARQGVEVAAINPSRTAAHLLEVTTLVGVFGLSDS